MGFSGIGIGFYADIGFGYDEPGKKPKKKQARSPNRGYESYGYGSGRRVAAYQVSVPSYAYTTVSTSAPTAPQPVQPTQARRMPSNQSLDQVPSLSGTPGSTASSAPSSLASQLPAARPHTPAQEVPQADASPKTVMVGWPESPSNNPSEKTDKQEQQDGPKDSA